MTTGRANNALGRTVAYALVDERVRVHVNRVVEMRPDVAPPCPSCGSGTVPILHRRHPRNRTEGSWHVNQRSSLLAAAVDPPRYLSKKPVEVPPPQPVANFQKLRTSV
jgi:hypothetical protein